MFAKYLLSLAITVGLISLAVIQMPFVVRSRVLSGQTTNEDLRLEFTFDAGSNRYYRITQEKAQSLAEKVRFPTEGPARVVDSHVAISPGSVSWKDGDTKYTAPGGVMTAHIKWDTPSDAQNGTAGVIYLDFPRLDPEGVNAHFRSGQYQIASDGRCIIRELTSYQSPAELFLARFGNALVVGLPFGILLHAIGWAFVLKREKKIRIANLPAQSPGFPQTFYPNPIAEWTIALILLGCVSLTACMIAAFSALDNLVDAGMIWFVYSFVAVAVLIALISAYFTGRSALTVHVDRNGLSYARGRNEPNWSSAAWSEIVNILEKTRSYRGATYHWIEIEFKDRRKKLKIPTSTVGYPTLRNLLFADAKR